MIPSIDRREFIIGGTAIGASFCLPYESKAFFPHGANPIQGLGQLTLALDPAYQYGVVAGTSNQPKLGYLLTTSADVSAGSLLTYYVNGSPLFSDHSLTAAEYNASDITNSGSALTPGTYSIYAKLVDGGITYTSNAISYTYNTGISAPTVSGTAVVTTPTPTYTITWGATKPNVGDTLVLYATIQGTTQDATTTPNKTYVLEFWRRKWIVHHHNGGDAWLRILYAEMLRLPF